MEDKTEEMAKVVLEGGDFDFVYYLLVLGIVVVGTYVGSFLREYSRKRADQFATKADLQDIQNQLRASVEITESVKRDIEQGAWRERELELLKRDKLEQYLLNYYTEVENLTRRMKRDFFYDKTSFEETADARISMLQKLYLPEMDLVHANFLRVHAEFTDWLGKGQRLLLDQRQAGIPLPVIPNGHMENYPALLSKLNECTLAIEAKAKEVGRQINVA